MPDPEWQPGSRSDPSDPADRWCISSGSTLRNKNKTKIAEQTETRDYTLTKIFHSYTRVHVLAVKVILTDNTCAKATIIMHLYLVDLFQY